MLLIERKDYFSDEEFTFVAETLAYGLTMFGVQNDLHSYEGESSLHPESKRLTNIASRYVKYMNEDIQYMKYMRKAFDFDGDDELGEFMKDYINSPDIKRVIFEHLIDSGEDISNITFDKMCEIAVAKIPQCALEFTKMNISLNFRSKYVNLNFSEKQKKLAVYLFAINALFFELETAKELTLYIANEYNLETEYALEIYDVASKQANLCIQIDKQTEELLEIILE